MPYDNENTERDAPPLSRRERKNEERRLLRLMKKREDENVAPEVRAQPDEHPGVI